MTNAKKIETAPKGKNVLSTDPRKPAIVAAFKAATHASKVTSLKETLSGSFQATCMVKCTGQRSYKHLGDFELVTEQPAPKAKKLARTALIVPTEEMRASSKTDPANFNDRVNRNELSPAEAAIIDYVNAHGTATVKEMAAVLFNGDYLKAKNAVRRPRWSGLIAHGVRGQYVAK